MKSSSPSQEDWVRAIVDDLRPLRCSENRVLAEVRNEVEELRKYLPQCPEVGFRGETKQYAKTILAKVDVLKKQLATAPLGFFYALALVENKEIDAIRDNHPDKLDKNCVHKGGDQFLIQILNEMLKQQLKTEVNELLVRLLMFERRCENLVLDPDPPGVNPHWGYRQHAAALIAFYLMMCFSTKKPTAGGPDSSFCKITSSLFEAVTGERSHDGECALDMRRACKHLVRMAPGLAPWVQLRAAQRTDAIGSAAKEQTDEKISQAYERAVQITADAHASAAGTQAKLLNDLSKQIHAKQTEYADLLASIQRDEAIRAKIAEAKAIQGPSSVEKNDSRDGKFLASFVVVRRDSAKVLNFIEETLNEFVALAVKREIATPAGGGIELQAAQSNSST